MQTLGALGGIPLLNGFKSKADALKYAIEYTGIWEDGRRLVNYEEAQKLYDFICGKLDLPEIEKDVTADAMKAVTDMIEEIKKGEK